ncbi:hypothetical protein BDF19DRAFT_431361 [Syncephalis fuscata]|nr:hypothetical protein BDF19DRAFT_431361 [Syncephalis fuscata]
MISSVLALIFIVQPIFATPRKANLPEDVFEPDPPQVYDGIDIPAGFEQGEETSWEQQLQGMDVNVMCRIRNNLNNKFRFLQDLSHKRVLLQNDPGRQYVLHPQRSFTFRGKRCFVMPRSVDENLNDFYLNYIPSLAEAKSILSFFTKLIQGINYIHKVGWTNISLNEFSIVVRSNLSKYPVINVMKIEQLRRIKFKNNIVVPIDAPQMKLLYLPEWIKNTKIDPRKADLWRIGELFYAFQYEFYFKMSKKSTKQILEETFSKMPDVKPELHDTQQQFKRFMPYFKKLIEDSYQSGLITKNNGRAILLNTNSGFPKNSIDISLSPIKQIYLTTEMLDLFIAAQNCVFGNKPLRGYSQFLLNGLFQLGIYSMLPDIYIAHPNEYTPVLDMLNRLLTLNPEERLTPDQYLRQFDRNTNANRLHVSD